LRHAVPPAPSLRSTSLRKSPRLLVALFPILLLLVPATSSAQLGGLVKRGAARAAEKAVDKSVDKAMDKKTGAKAEVPAPTFDDEVLELTPARIDQVVKGLKAFNEARAKADVPGAMKAFEAANARSADYSNRYSDQRYAHQEKVRKVEQCREEVFDAQREANQAETDRKMEAMRTDPAKMQAMAAVAMKWNPRIAQAQAKGDTAEIKSSMIKMQEELATIAGLKLDTDSTKADAKCGKPAPAPAWLVAWDSTDAEARRLGERVREAETAGQEEAVAASGLTARQFHVARERIEAFVGDGGMGFSKSERAALAPRKDELKAYFPAG
jgi:hypothetical protein